MAAAPVKQLHNFPLSLKWESIPQTLCPEPDLEADPTRPSSTPSLPPPRVGSRSARCHRFSFAACSASLPQRPLIPPPDDLPKPPTEDDDESSRHWNLRPRRPNGCFPPIDGIAIETKSMRPRALAESSIGGGLGLGLGLGSNCETVKGKRKIWVALSKDEIEEDVFILTGSRPARRPKKRPRNVQKVLDSVFPGLWLVGVAADSYRITETPARGR